MWRVTHRLKTRARADVIAAGREASLIGLTKLRKYTRYAVTLTLRLDERAQPKAF